MMFGYQPAAGLFSVVDRANDILHPEITQWIHYIEQMTCPTIDHVFEVIYYVMRLPIAVIPPTQK